MKNALLTLAGILGISGASAQIVIQNTATPEELVQDVLLGTGVVISNVVFNGVPGTTASDQMGFFDGENCNLGIDYGVIIASGGIQGAAGPNNTAMQTTPLALGGLSDPDLQALIGPQYSVEDAGVLEFDLIAVSDTIMFSFVFASEEYLEYVNTSFNDVFGFFLSGPGINGPYTDGAMNIAMIPGTNTPISIDNVNEGANAAYYVNNGNGYVAPNNTDPQYIQYDGFTVPITIIAHVLPDETYHMKIAIGDAGDASFDSAVFLSGASFMSPLDPSTGLPDGAAAPAIIAAPNPATDRLRLAYTNTGRSTLRISDALGRQVLRADRNASTSGVPYEFIDVSAWPAGSYLVQLISATGEVNTTRVVVSH